MKTKNNPYLSGKMIEPLALEGNENVADMVDNVFGGSGYNARRLSEACELYTRMLDDDTTVCLTLAGAMTPIGMSGSIIKMMEMGFIDFIISTGANLYHDLHRVYNYPVHQGEFYVDDNDLNKHGVARIYDTFILDDDTLMATDFSIRKSLLDRTYDKPISTATMHKILGDFVAKDAPHPEKSVLATAAKCGVPIFTSSPGDSSIGMNLISGHLFGNPVPLDPILDIIESTAIVRDAKKNGAVIVGGGSPKNFYMQTQPTLWQILWDSMGGHDYFIQLTMDSPQWGGLSGATPQEAKSWGKIKDAKRNNVVVYSCASLTYPIICQYALQRRKAKPLKRIYGKLDAIVEKMSKTAMSNQKFVRAHEKVLPKAVYDKKKI